MAKKTTRFDKKQPYPKYTSQFVQKEYPFEAAMKAGQQLQKQVDRVRQASSKFDEVLQVDAGPLPGYQKRARELESQYEKRKNQIIQEFRKDGNTGKAARQLQSLASEWQKDPERLRIEQFGKVIRDQDEQFRKMRRQSDQNIPLSHAWFRNEEGEYVDGLDEEGNIIPPKSLSGYTSPEEMRQDFFESKVNDVEGTVEERIEGTNKIREFIPPERLESQFGVQKVSGGGYQFTERGKRLFRDFIETYGNSLRTLALERGSKTSKDIAREMRNIYLSQAADVINEHSEVNVRIDESAEGEDGEDTAKVYQSKTSGEYNIHTPQIDQIISALKEEKGRDKINKQLLQSVSNKAQEAYEDNPDRFNVQTIQQALTNAKAGDLSSTDRDVLETVFGKSPEDISPKNIQTKINALQQTKRRLAKPKMRDFISSVKSDNYTTIQIESGYMQDNLSDVNFGTLEAIDAESGVQFQDSFSSGDLSAFHFVHLPLQKDESGIWKVSDDEGETNLFLEAEGSINTDNLTEEQRQQMHALGKDVYESGADVPYKEAKKEPHFRSNKILIPVTSQMADEIKAATESDDLAKTLDNYFQEATTTHTKSKRTGGI